MPKYKLKFIMGNPPFVGARLMSKEQKSDVDTIFGKAWKNAGNLDYVSCWYKKAADMMSSTQIRVTACGLEIVRQMNCGRCLNV